MFIDSTILYGLVKELKAMLLSTQVKQIHQLDARVFDIELYRPMASAAHLILCVQNPPYLYAVSSRIKSAYIEAQTFCMTLRKHLEGSRLSDIAQIQMDRIVKLSFDRIEAEGRILTKELYVELIPSAPNLILTENNRILDVLIRGRKQHRILNSQSEYALPEGSNRLNIMQFSQKELMDIFLYHRDQPASLRDLLFSLFNGLSTPLVDEMARRAAVPLDAPISSLSADDLSRVAGTLCTLTEQVEQSSGLYIYSMQNKEWLSLIPLSMEHRAYVPSISAWISQFSEKNGNTISAGIQTLKKYVNQLIKREQRKAKKIQGELEEASLLDKYQLWGNLLSIYAYMNIIGQTEITVDNPFDEEGKKETIPLLPEYSLIRNSQLYFKKYNRMKTRLTIGREKWNECNIKIDYLKNVEYFIGEIHDRAQLQAIQDELKRSGIDRYVKPTGKKKGKEPAAEEPLTFFIEDHRVWIGRNNRQNEALTLHRAQKKDLWLHAQKIPGAHVVIETGDTDVPISVIEEAAAWAAWFSKGKYSGKVTVDYTPIRYVRKIPNSPPGLVSYTHQKSLVVTPQEPTNT